MSTKNQSDPQPSPARPQTSTAKEQAPRPAGAPPSGQPQRPVSPQVVHRPRSLPPTTARPAATADQAPKDRLFSLDAYRGFVMIVLVAMGFGLLELSKLPENAPVWQYIDYGTWQPRLEHNFQNTTWESSFDWIGVSFWDLIQPAFLFIVGVAMPLSYARRAAAGEGVCQRTIHALFRALVLVLLGVFLASTTSQMTNWTFTEALSQIGLGYFFAYLIMTICRRFWIQAVVFILILAGYWGWFYSYTPPPGYDYKAVGAAGDEVLEGRFVHWSKNANAAHNFDVWFLNKFPRPVNKEFKYSETGEQTLNFIPAIGTILLGVFCGQLMISDRRWWQKFFGLVVGGGVCLGLGVVAGMYACPIVKRLWTPSWVLFSGAWVIWGLALFYLLFDLCRLRWIGWPLVVVGLNSLVFYFMYKLIQPWAVQQMQTHFDVLWALAVDAKWLARDMFGWLVGPVSALIMFWLIGLVLYCKKAFVRV